MVIADVCMCAYTSHGHCGIIEDVKLYVYYLPNIYLQFNKSPIKIYYIKRVDWTIKIL